MLFPQFPRSLSFLEAGFICADLLPQQPTISFP